MLQRILDCVLRPGWPVHVQFLLSVPWKLRSRSRRNHRIVVDDELRKPSHLRQSGRR